MCAWSAELLPVFGPDFQLELHVFVNVRVHFDPHAA